MQVSGGKERIRHFLHSEGFDDKKNDETELIRSSELPLSPGVMRLMKEVMDKKLTLGICTTSNEKAAHEIAYRQLEDI